MLYQVFINNVLCIYGEQMILEERRKELEKHIKYIEMVLREKKDELFCLNVEIKQQKEKGA